MTTLNFSESKEIEKAEQWLTEYWQKPVSPDYIDATSVADAIALLAKHGRVAKIFAGGTDLIKLRKSGMADHHVLVNIKPIKALNQIALQDAGLEIGALARIADIETSDLVKEQFSMLAEAAHLIGSPQIRQMSTAAGNLCQETRCWYYRRPPDTGLTFNCRRKDKKGNCPALDGENQYHAITGKRKCVSVCPSDLATAMMAMDAELLIVSEKGERSILIEDFYMELGNCLESTEMIKTIRIPPVAPTVHQKFMKFRIRKAIDFAIASTAVSIKIDPDDQTVQDAKIVLGGVSYKPLRAIKAEQRLKGKIITEQLAWEAAELSISGLKPLEKNAYKLPIVKSLVKRALPGAG